MHIDNNNINYTEKITFYYINLINFHFCVNLKSSTAIRNLKFITHKNNIKSIANEDRYFKKYIILISISIC